MLDNNITPLQIFNFNKNELINRFNIEEEFAEHILDKEIRKKVNKDLEYMLKNKIDYITFQEDKYPQLLKFINDPPIGLYIKGNSNILNQKSISIIGARICSDYGKNATIYFAKELSKRNINVISGLAKGIDSFSHIGTIQNGGKTIAVLGNGLDKIYPEENKFLAEKILETNGAIISEYPINSKIEKINFPARNRIISGMTTAILVVEAKKKSGALITVDYALEQGKEIFVVPGNINSVFSVGTNELIKQGATLVSSVKDILNIVFK